MIRCAQFSATATARIRREVPKGTVLIKEGGKTGHLFVLIAGRLEVLRGDAVVAVLSEPGAVTGEMSMLLDRPHTATVRAGASSTVYEIEDADRLPEATSPRSRC